MSRLLLVLSVPLFAIPLLERYARRRTAEATAEVLRASSFAAFKHRQQKRKTLAQPPYIEHPLRVSEILAAVQGHNVPLLQAALLHDTIEDTDTTADELRQVFGPRVAELVLEVTDDKALGKEERKRLQIEHAPTKSPDAKLLSLADKIANLEDLLTRPNGSGIPQGWTVQRIQNYVAWSVKVAKGLRGGSKPLDERFDELVQGSFQFTDGRTYPALPEDVENAKLV